MVADKSFNQIEMLYGRLELIRPPNLFTIPGDVLAGASLALISPEKIPHVFPVIAISLLLYMSGLIINDCCDRNIDAIERPHRPIPSGSDRSTRREGTYRIPQPLLSAIPPPEPGASL